ncbi:uncharacterized protein LOC143619697 isoform X2 [Bidens hawaiensis]|uniref:uncharacterized protein LOC143619697 isoform X2 n=1 Tax=Bidens hawaiensis TaxID=980011 RepID=UPI00404B44AF
MASFAVKMMAGSLPPVTESKGSNAAATSLKPSTLPLQVRIKEHQKLETSETKSTNISRRNLALFLTAASFSAVSLSQPKPAAAGISKAEMKKIILEKLKFLREKIGLSKQETEENEKIASPSATSAPPVPPEPVLPGIQNDKKTVVEAATLP